VAFCASQAIGGSMLDPLALPSVSNTFTDRRQAAIAVVGPGGVGRRAPRTRPDG